MCFLSSFFFGLTLTAVIASPYLINLLIVLKIVLTACSSDGSAHEIWPIKCTSKYLIFVWFHVRCVCVRSFARTDNTTTAFTDP